MGTPNHQPDLKQKYDEMLKKLAKNKRPKDIMRRQWIKLTIQRILSAKDIEDKSNLPHLVKEALESFDLDNTEPEPRLVTRLNKLNEHEKIVIPLEESFEIVLKAHLFTHHGGCAAMNKWLSDHKYEPSIVCVPALINVCQQCNLGTTNPQIITIEDTPNNTIVASKKIPQRTTKTPRAKRKVKTIKVTESSDNIVKEIPKVTPTLQDVNINIISKMSISFVNLIDMSSRPDSLFYYLLIHQDINTRFVQIRPITKYDVVEEISMELVKLFCDFAPPQCLILRSDLMTIFEGVVARLNVIFDPKIAIETCGPAEIKISKDIIDKILAWLRVNECNSWSIGCYNVQWDLNKCVDIDGTSPFEKFFGINYKENQLAAIHDKNSQGFQLSSTPKHTDAIEKSTVTNNKKANVEITKAKKQIPALVTGEALITPNAETHSKSLVEEESDVEVKKDREKHICCTCKDLMRSEVYFCCVCKKSLHLYCGARRKGDNDVMENICYTCLNL